MENIKIEGTDRSPDVDFDFQANIFSLRGMCYLENVSEFFKPVLEVFEPYLKDLSDAEVSFSFHMSYFNSSSARIIMRLFDLLDATAERGNKVSIIWNYEEDDDSMEEQGEDFGEDLEHASFEMKAIPD